MPTLLADTNLFLWVDLENPTPEEAHRVLESIFHFHPLSIEDCVAVSESPKVEEYTPKEGDRFTPYLFMVIHAVDYSRKDGVFATSELNFFLGKNFLVTYHQLPLKSVHMTEERCLRGTGHIARAPDRVAHTLLDGIVDNYKPALDELSLEIAQLEHEVVQTPDKGTLNRLLQIKKEVLHLRHIVSPQREVLARFAHGVHSVRARGHDHLELPERRVPRLESGDPILPRAAIGQLHPLHLDQRPDRQHRAGQL